MGESVIKGKNRRKESGFSLAYLVREADTNISGKEQEEVMRGSSERRHRREGLGIHIEREKIGGRKKVWEADFSVEKRCSSLEPIN